MNYKQQSNQGCLVVNLMYLFDITPTKEKEQNILNEGLFRLRDNYALGCVLAFLDRYPSKAMTLYVDNAHYLASLQKWAKHPRITIVHQKNNQKLLDSLAGESFIVYVDNNITDGWTHLPHFIMVTDVTDKFYRIFDPWNGKTIRISKSKLLTGIDLLRNHIKVCPIIISVG